jgi:hypothetical protein
MRYSVQQNSVRSVHGLRLRQAGSLAALLCLTLLPGTSQQPNNPPRNVPEFLNRLPDVNDQARMRQEQKSEADFTAANALRQKKVTEDSARLLQMATDLKTDIEKAGKDTLSVSALRKADAIEKLAHSIKQRLTLSMNSN